MDNFIGFLFTVICVVSLVFSIISIKPGFLKYVDAQCSGIGVKKISGYFMSTMILLGWCILYTFALNALLWPYEPKWVLSTPMGIFLMLLSINWLKQYKKTD